MTVTHFWHLFELQNVPASILDYCYTLWHFFKLQKRARFDFRWRLHTRDTCSKCKNEPAPIFDDCSHFWHFFEFLERARFDVWWPLQSLGTFSNGNHVPALIVDECYILLPRFRIAKMCPLRFLITVRHFWHFNELQKRAWFYFLMTVTQLWHCLIDQHGDGCI